MKCSDSSGSLQRKNVQAALRVFQDVIEEYHYFSEHSNPTIVAREFVWDVEKVVRNALTRIEWSLFVQSFKHDGPGQRTHTKAETELMVKIGNALYHSNLWPTELYLKDDVWQ